MNNLLYFRKRMTEKQAHDYVSEKHRIDDVDNKVWGKSIAVFWACIFAFGLFMAVVKYATACGDITEPEIIEIRVISL